MSQADEILSFMMQIPGRRISTWVAYERFHCTTLAQRIADLKKEGNFKLNGTEYFINDEYVTRDGKSFSEYWLEPVPEKQLELQF